MNSSDITTKKLFQNVPKSLEELFSKFNYPWEVLDSIGEFIKSNYNALLAQGYSEIKPGVLIGKGTTVAETALIEAPAILGNNCEVRHCAYIRGNVITGDLCVIGNSTEVKNSILFDQVQIPHFNYVGDSILGNKSHLGAGAVCSNVRQDKCSIKIKTEPPLDTKRHKLGAIIGNSVEIGCGAVINPGTIICNTSRIYPLTSVRGIIPKNSIVKSTNNIVEIK